MRKFLAENIEQGTLSEVERLFIANGNVNLLQNITI